MTARGQPPEYSPIGAKTLWLAAEREGDRSGLLPFGWLLVERAEAHEIPALKHWCDEEPKPDLTAVRARLAEARTIAANEAAARAERERKRVADEVELLRAAQQREAHRASLSQQGRLVESLRDKLERHGGPKQPVSGALYADVQKLVKAALDGGWGEPDKQALAELVAGLAFEKIDFGGKTKEIKRAINHLKGDA
jgi:hypothetical protein